MKTIWKYQLSHQVDTRLHLPEGARIAHVGVDPEGATCLWAQVDPSITSEVERQFGIYGTGGHVPDFWEYVGTVHEEHYVWHVFENMQMTPRPYKQSEMPL